jgi:hypothetical protein
MIKNTCREILPAQYFANWFSAGAMRFFNTVIVENSGRWVDGTFYFVTNETRDKFVFSNGSVSPRVTGYTLRRCTANGIETIGELMQYPTSAAAMAAVPS